jgi:hypothetical protein
MSAAAPVTFLTDTSETLAARGQADRLELRQALTGVEGGDPFLVSAARKPAQRMHQDVIDRRNETRLSVALMQAPGNLRAMRTAAGAIQKVLRGVRAGGCFRRRKLSSFQIPLGGLYGFFKGSDMHELNLSDDAARTLLRAAESGLWGLVLAALASKEGGPAARALAQNVRDGRAKVDVSVTFDHQGVFYAAVYESHGARSRLFDLQTIFPDGEKSA